MVLSVIRRAFREPAEWHAFAHGVYHGLRSWSEPMPAMPTHPDVALEPHYYKGGYAVGKFIPVVMMWLLARVGRDDVYPYAREHVSECPSCGHTHTVTHTR